MTFRFTVEVEIERVQGKFAGREEIGEAIQRTIEEADPGSFSDLGADGASEYEIGSWDVSEEVKK